MFRNIRYSLLGGVLLALSSAPACTSSGGKSGYDNFLTAATAAPADGYTIWWLGREFTAGGATFTGPAVADIGGRLDAGGVSMSYYPQAPLRTGSLDVSLYSRDGWSKAEAMGVNRLSRGATSRSVSVAGHQAILTVTPFPPAPSTTGHLSLTVDLGDTVALASVGRASLGRGTPDTNPLLDEATFLSVMQHLRPYPE
jgi:hypothetical protein